MNVSSRVIGLKHNQYEEEKKEKRELIKRGSSVRNNYNKGVGQSEFCKVEVKNFVPK